MAASNSAFLPGGMRMSATSRIMAGSVGVKGRIESGGARSDAEVARQRLAVVGQRRRLAGEHDAALLEHDRVVGVGEHGARSCGRRSASRCRCARISAIDAPDLGDDQRRQAFGRLVEDQQVAGWSSARGRSTSICCSPPESCWPPWPSRSARRGKVASTRSKVQSRCAVGAGARRHHQVLAHREVREDAAALGHVADAAPRHLLGRPRR